MSRYRTELLPNGLLYVYDYMCQWALLFHKDEKGKWEAHGGNAGLPVYKHLIKKINKCD